MNDTQLAGWAVRHESTILAALGLAALQYSDPSLIFQAIRDRYPERDFRSWEAQVSDTRELSRAVQDGPA